eukprot:TRINITY_DN3673_c0_g1_i7.p1 TRINITY_DN3673_c0_g1~~TRINITY_DN3673_c0_g1_i7.p1  ORF type:complete len:178 (-),score=54.84 TRINITY_DN3673_c0_g1_i7:194-682(-)
MGAVGLSSAKKMVFALAASCLLLSSLSNVSGHTKGTDAIAYFDAYLPSGTYCAPRRPVTGWTVNYDRYRPADGTGANVDSTYFNSGSGTYTTPAAGVYHCCASFRCKENSYCDFTVIRNANSGAGDINFAAFGSRTLAGLAMDGLLRQPAGLVGVEQVFLGR